MARYTGPVCRLCRRAGEKLFLKGERCLTPKCAVERRQGPPGQVFARRRKLSEHALQLREKQKARRIYGVLEQQFRRHYEEAQRRPGITGENLLQILEMRLDNVIYRLGFADSRSQARQLVTHGHFIVNGHHTNVPSMETKPGDSITVSESSRRLEYFQALPKDLRRKMPPNWLSIDPEQLAARVMTKPSRVDIGIKLNEQAIVEFYSR